jgi:hypothetical protein
MVQLTKLSTISVCTGVTFRWDKSLMVLLSYSAWKVVINATNLTLANNAKPKGITS